ncbi:MAG: hypothetical protein GEU82_05065 [Luteitalea sp.]|nr:hypothetical protein [Luteitalea sp.]
MSRYFAILQSCGYAIVCLLVVARAAGAGQTGPLLRAPDAAAPASAGAPFTFDGPAAPLPPAVVARDESGRVTIRAVRLTTPIQIDGQLDEAVYATVPSISDFIQNDPSEGAPATEKTEVWIFFDGDSVIVTARCWESRPERLVANEMRRDGANVPQNDNFAWMFDTFYDRRNGVIFEVTPVGGRLDGQVTNERQLNRDWNPVWDVKVGRFEGGWVVEAALPFKSLRFRPGRAQIWGFNARRVNRWKNEVSYLTPIAAVHGRAGHFRASLAATVTGLEAPAQTRNLEMKPFANANMTSDRLATPPVLNALGADVGVDLKYGITQGLTADLTYNTDFAQVEADEQQVNLTRFNLSFPEKRDFFLENQGTFTFGGVTSGMPNMVTDTPMLFYSRRIGLDRGRPIPIVAGGRLTGRVGRFALGVLNVQSGEDDDSAARATNFSVLRLKGDILRRSSVGVLATARSVGASGAGTNQAYGADAAFVLSDMLTINTYWARTHTDGLSGDDTSYRAQLDYNGDRYGVQAERLIVGDDFNPEVGFVRRDDMRRSFGQFRFSPRPEAIKAVRKFFYTGTLNYVENGAGQLETRSWDGEFAAEFQSSDRFEVAYSRTFEFLPAPFGIGSGVTLPSGEYEFATGRVGVDFGRQRRISGNVAAEHGTFYNGHKTAFTLTQGRMNLSPQLSIEPTYSLNRVKLVEGAFVTHLLGSRVTHTMTPLMFASALLQYNSASHAVGVNVRLRWEYQPGSELFVVFDEQRDTLGARFPELANRALVVKITRLFRL